MIDILMPRLSDTMEEGAIAVWHKRPGDRVDVGDILVEIETDKATMEYEAYEAGVLRDIVVGEGELAAIGTRIAVLDDGSSAGAGDGLGGGDAVAAPGPVDAEPVAVDAVVAESVVAESDAAEPMGERPAAVDGGSSRTERVFSSPLARKVAREHGVDLDRVTGTGPGGRIVRADVLDAIPDANSDPTLIHDAQPAAAASSRRAAESPASPRPADDPRNSTAVPFDASRRIIAKRLAESTRTAPHFFVTAVADVEELVGLRQRVNADRGAVGGTSGGTSGGGGGAGAGGGAGGAGAGDGGAVGDRPKLSVNDLVVRAVAIALRSHPGVNASYSEDGSGSTLLHDRVNVGVAIAAASGLVVPVIRDADQKTVSRIGSETKRFVAAAGDRKLTAADLSGGTFTVSNLGMFGVEQFTAVINPPEGAILAVGATVQEPAVVDGAIVPRHRMRLTLSADHRIIDGALAARFLQTLTALLERPLDIFA